MPRLWHLPASGEEVAMGNKPRPIMNAGRCECGGCRRKAAVNAVRAIPRRINLCRTCYELTRELTEPNYTRLLEDESDG